ncbi:hypothetical protein E8F20_06015 [Pseudomonas sp. BN415]|uniref:hypothetical protein n=1 Tax=Pseudomonas sp. BN415 TaxID=2567889 RepID=UPI0024564F31|nr:hypothetical protein [Pseudomonas sp. BN415]MDH4581431.1 hypothetical protein [Pseudomonas sp. BN415]
MPAETEALAIAGVNPKTRECTFIARRHPDDVMEALEEGLIVVPVTAEKARWAYGEVIDDLEALMK